MKITWLGTGAAGTLNNWHTNALITFDNGYNLLVDCGGDCRHALHDAGLSHRDINGVYISHLHADHVGGLEILGFKSYFDPDYDNPDDSEWAARNAHELHGRPQLFCSEALVDSLWTTLRGGMGSLQNKVCTLATYFDVRPVARNGTFRIDGIDFRVVQTIHYVDGFTFAPSFGLLFTVDGETIFLTTDTQHAPAQIKDFYNEATTIFHDCETGFASGVHAHFDELCGLSAKTKAKIWLVHYDDNAVADDGKLAGEWIEKVSSAGFHGIVPKGTVFEFEQ